VVVNAYAPSSPAYLALLFSLLRVAAGSAQVVTGAHRAAAALPVRGPFGRPSRIVRREGEPPLPDGMIRFAGRLVRSGPSNGQQLGLSDAAASAGAKVLAAVPLRLGASRGCLLAASDSRRAFSPAEMAGLARVAQDAALTMGDVDVLLDVERRRLGRTLHDTLGQTLTSLIFAIDALDEHLESGERRRLTQPVRAQALKAVRETREMIDITIMPVAGQETLRRIQERVRELSDSGVEVRFRNDLGKQTLPLDVAHCVYHVAREALLNVRRHAHAGHATVLLWCNRGRVEIVVSDDGKGLPRKVVPTTGWGHFGLAMMREHVEDAGGTFIIQSAARQGTRIIARLPLPGVRTS